MKVENVSKGVRFTVETLPNGQVRLSYSEPKKTESFVIAAGDVQIVRQALSNVLCARCYNEELGDGHLDGDCLLCKEPILRRSR